MRLGAGPSCTDAFAATFFVVRNRASSRHTADGNFSIHQTDRGEDGVASFDVAGTLRFVYGVRN